MVRNIKHANDDFRSSNIIVTIVNSQQSNEIYLTYNVDDYITNAGYSEAYEIQMLMQRV